MPSLELPPPLDALVDSLNIIFTRSLHDLSKAEWATVKREDYMRIVRERKQQCPAFANVVIREDEAGTRLPAHGIPEQVACCAQEVDGSENAPARLTGPASRAPDVGKDDGAGDESDAGDDSDDASEDPEASEARACSKPAEISGRPKSLKHYAKTGRGDLREAQILETLCKNGPRRSPGGPNP